MKMENVIQTMLLYGDKKIKNTFTLMTLAMGNLGRFQKRYL
jgi:hypothetical protein